MEGNYQQMHEDAGAILGATWGFFNFQGRAMNGGEMNVVSGKQVRAHSHVPQNITLLHL